MKNWRLWHLASPVCRHFSHFTLTAAAIWAYRTLELLNANFLCSPGENESQKLAKSNNNVPERQDFGWVEDVGTYPPDPNFQK